MLSTDEVYHSILFAQAYKEALDTVEQIAEKRNSVQRYKDLTADIAGGMKNAEIMLRKDGVKATNPEKPFKYFKMWTFAKGVYDKYKLSSAKSYKDLNNLLDKAITDLSTQI